MIRTCPAIRHVAVALALLTAALPTRATARTLAGVTMPDTMTVDGTTLHLNGMGLRSYTFLKVHGYVAGLYVPTPTHSAQEILDTPGPKLLRIQYVHSGGVGRVQDEFRDGRKLNCAEGCPKANDAAFDQLFGTARAVTPGDTSTYIYGPASVEILFNGKSLATIQNADFSRRLLDAMVGAHPTSTVVRDGLLGG